MMQRFDLKGQAPKTFKVWMIIDNQARYSFHHHRIHTGWKKERICSGRLFNSFMQMKVLKLFESIDNGL